MDLLSSELIRGLVEMASDFFQVKDIGFDSPGRAIAELEILDKPLAQWGHDVLSKISKVGTLGREIMRHDWPKRKSAQSLPEEEENRKNAKKD
jgi:hypothetical protein